MSLPLNQIILGDCTEVMRTWPAESIDLVVTSPPYWGLRDYGEETVRVWGHVPECEHEWEMEKLVIKSNLNENFNERWGGSPGQRKQEKMKQIDAVRGLCVKCGAWRGSLGLEPHPQMFIDHLVEICGEIKRILKPTGTFWLNLGDTYFGGMGTYGKPKDWKDLHEHQNYPAGEFYKNRNKLRSNWLQPKQKLMIPARVAIALQHDGFILRNSICWWKPNAMPSSVKDRLTCAYEHVFLFAKQRRYYFDLDAIRQPHAASAIDRYEREKEKNLKSVNLDNKWLESNEKDSMKGLHGKSYADMKYYENPLGKNPGNLWEVEKEKLTKHDIAVGRIGNFSYTDPLHTKEYHPAGKNPADLWEGSKFSLDDGYRQGMNRDESAFSIQLKNPPEPEKIVNYLRKWKGSHSYKEIDKTLGYDGDCASHWFTLPSRKHGFSYPSPKDWIRLKTILGFDSTFDVAMTETMLVSQQIQANPKGRNPGDLWRISTRPFPAAHFATFPPALIEPIVKAGSPKWICSRCGKPRTRLTETSLIETRKTHDKGKVKTVLEAEDKRRVLPRARTGIEGYNIHETVGWSDCGCGESFDPGVILDPFCGSGTALRVARRLGRRFIGIDVVPEYVEMAQRRIRGDRFKELPDGVLTLDFFINKGG